MLNFQEQLQEDIDNVFLNAEAMEFVTTHKIEVVEGLPSAEHELQIVVDPERYTERQIKDKIENVNLNGFVFFVKKSLWLEKFPHVPRPVTSLLFDGEMFLVNAVADDMGVLEITLEAPRGAWGHG